ncbi:hypothetical protein A4R29_19230 [Mesorhizobium ciceri biovar biserrulae]|nr:hypothetical protein A4R29_19230 [Mesorhizobium ciceri biovar biserrulae]
MARPFKSVLITNFSDDEVHGLIKASPQIANALDGVSRATFELLSNPFNMQLAVEVVGLSSGNHAIAHLANQAALLSAYWASRLPDFAQRQTVEKVVLLMIDKESLVLSGVDLSSQHAQVIELILPTGVLVNENFPSTKIAFRHHILFDFAASLAKFRGDNVQQDVSAVSRNAGLGFVLAPALRFHLQRIWDRDTNRSMFWNYVAEISGQSSVDPIARASTARAVVELVKVTLDIEALIAIFRRSPSSTATSLQEIMQEVRLGIRADKSAADAWAALADALMDYWRTESLYPMRLLLFSLSDISNLSDTAFAQTGNAARKFLQLSMSKKATSSQSMEAQHGLRIVSKTYRSDIEASRATLTLAISQSQPEATREQNLSTLCQCIDDIIDADADLAAIIYAVVFDTPSPNEETTSLGTSQILSLTSTRRQDFESSFWMLGQAYTRLWSKSQIAAVEAMVSAARSHIKYEHQNSDKQSWTIKVGGHSFKLKNDYSFIWAPKFDDDMYGRRAGPAIASFSKLLRTAPDDQVMTVVEALTKAEPPAILWARILSAGAVRPLLLGDILWPFVSEAAFFECQDTRRDTIDFLESIWPSRDGKERNTFQHVLIKDFSVEIQRLALSAIPLQQLTLAADLKRRFETDGPLEKPARTDFEIISREYDWIREAGVDVDAGPNGNLRSSISSFESQWTESPRTNDPVHLAEVLAGLIDATDRAVAQGVDWRIADEAWGKIADSLHKYFSEDPHTYAMSFSLIARGILLRISDNPNPQAKAGGYEDSGFMSWGSPAPRLEAASALVVLARQPDLLNDEVRAVILKLLNDPVPTVRLQIAQSLNALWETDRPFMWEMIENVARNERHNGVLQYFIGGTLGRLMHAEPERVGLLTADIVKRVAPLTGEGRDRALEQAADLLTILWLWRNWAQGEVVLRSWLASMAANEMLLWHAVSQLRNTLTVGISGDVNLESNAVRQRAQSYARLVVSAAAKALDRFRAAISPDDDISKEARSAAKLLDHLVMEIYFGCGAYAEGKSREPIGLLNDDQKLQFLDEMIDVLSAASDTGAVHTLHYLLEVVEFLMPGAPGRCIDLAFAAVLDGAEGGGYATEQMGADLFVRIIRTSLADYRDLYRDKVRRERLLDALDRFLQAGSPEARRLLHELPDALR